MITSHYTTSHHTTSHYTPHHTTYITPHHTTHHTTYITPHHIIPHYKSQHNTTQHNLYESLYFLAVRLVGSDKPDEGRVEVYYEDEWGTICDKGWGFDDADVLCYELGFEDADDLLSADEVPDGKGKIWLEDTSCTGSEDYLRSCANGGVGNSTCDHSRDAGVQCSLTGKLCIEGEGIRATNILFWQSTIP